MPHRHGPEADDVEPRFFKHCPWREAWPLPFEIALKPGCSDQTHAFAQQAFQPGRRVTGAKVPAASNASSTSDFFIADTDGKSRGRGERVSFVLACVIFRSSGAQCDQESSVAARIQASV